jgi:hypothetical protein
MSITGVVQDVKENKRLKIDGEWYGAFSAFPFPVNAGDTVSFEWAWSKDNKYRNIKGAVTKVASGAPPASSGGSTGSSNRDLTIIRQNSLAHATALVVASGVSDVYNAKDLVIDLAQSFAAYSEKGAVPEAPADGDWS